MQWNAFRSCVSHLPVKGQACIEQAFALGKEAHNNQKRLSGEPYFSHPIAVARILAEMGGDADTIVAALLHDTIEDTSLTLDEIEKRFGTPVASLINGVTKLSGEDVKHKPKEDEQIETLRKMFTLMREDIRIMVIKLADRLHNMQTVEFLPAAKRSVLAQETLDIYVKIAERLSMQDLRNELEALCISILEPTMFRELNDIRLQNEETGRVVLKEMEHAIRKLNGNLPKGLEIKYEQTTWPKIRAQHDSEGCPVTGLSTVTAVFVCQDVAGCFQVLCILHQLWKRESLSFQDFINSPKINGYRALHTTIILENGTRVRCKIRTEEMQRYARHGITEYCFDSKAAGCMSYIRWTQRIAPLSEDTVEHSEDFWESLKSDILGESILIHGSGDQTMLVPKDATALDGAFYFFGEEALKTKEIRVNGTPVKFYEHLPYACSITAVFAKKEQVDFSWLHYVHTGIASALIHKGLAKAPRPQKQEFGKKLLNTALRKYRRVGLDEITTQALERTAEEMGSKDVSRLFEKIAEGKIHAREAALTLFPKQGRRAKSNEHIRRSKWSVSIRYPLILSDEVTKVVHTFRPKKLTYKVQNKTRGHIRAQYVLSIKQQQQLSASLNTILQGTEWSLRPSSFSKYITLTFLTLLILWGLDPVVARTILQGGIRPIDLAIIRFITLFASAAFVFGTQTFFLNNNLKPLSPLVPSLLLSSVALFCTAFFSYLALSIIPATQYILFVIAGLVLLAILNCIFGNCGKRCINAIGSFLVVLVGIAVLSQFQNFTLLSTLYATGSGLGFALYSQASKRYLQEEAMVTARYPAFLFWLSLICLLLSFLLLPFHTIHTLPISRTILVALFVIIFTAIPYFLFFEALRRIEGAFLDNTLPFVCIATALGETVITQSLVPLIVLPFMATFLWQFVMYLRSN